MGIKKLAISGLYELWGTKELFMSLSRLSFNPPLHGYVENYGPCKPHWDASINQPMPFNVIGMLYLNNVSKEQGAFHVFRDFTEKSGSGFHRYLKGQILEMPLYLYRALKFRLMRAI